MDATLKGLIGLIGGPDVEARCAALVALTHLEAADERVVRAVGEALASRNVVVRDFAIGYLERVRPRPGLAHLVPLLDSTEDAVRTRTVAILAAYGAPAIVVVRALVKDAPRRRRNAIIDLCARVRSAAALDLLFEQMASDDPDISRAACDALVGGVPGLDARARADLFARADQLAAGAHGHRLPLVAAAKLFGALGDATARRRLFALLDPREPHVVRTHALGALTVCLRGEKLNVGEIDTLLPLLEEEDEAGYLRPTIRLLEDQALDRRYQATLNRLAESPQPLVKRFAVAKLGAFDSGRVIKTLIGYLTDDSYARRDQATASLKIMPAARGALMKELLVCDDERKAWTLADILLVHDRSWKRDVTAALWKRLEWALDQREDRLHAAYFHFLHTLEPEALAERMRARAERLRKSKRFADCEKTLLLLKDTPAFDAEAKFALAVADLKGHRRSLAVPRRHDLALDLFRDLARTEFPAAERLRRERALSPDDLYYAAFQLAGHPGQDRTLARELLAHLADKHGRTKVGKAAKNKLRLLGSSA